MIKLKKFKIFLVVLASFVILFAGSSIAYYNTKSFGFDEDAVFFQRNEDGIVFLDQEIKYKDIDNALTAVGGYLPGEAYTTVNVLNNDNIVFDKLYNYLP